MQMKQQQELQRYLEQVQQNIETVSASELLQAIMAQQTYQHQLDPVVSHGMSSGAGTVWSSFASPSAAAAGVIYSTAGLHQAPLPATFVPLVDVITTSDTVAVNEHQVLPSASVDHSLHSESCAEAATAVSQAAAVDALTSADWPGAASSAVNADTATAAVPDDSLDPATEAAPPTAADRSGSPSIVSLRRASSLKEQTAARPTASSDCEVSTSDQSISTALRRKQSAETAAFLLDPALHVAPPLPLTSADPSVDIVVPPPPTNLPELPSLDFVPIQNQPISSRSDSMDSMASSLGLAGSAMQQSIEGSDLVHQPVRETSVAESTAKLVLSCQPTVCSMSAQPATAASSQRPAELLDTLQQLLLGQFAGGNSADTATTPGGQSLSSAATNEPAQQLQQSQVIIQQQQQQQLSAIASAIQNLQHLRSLQEAIGSLAVALKTSQLQMLSGEVLQAAELNTTSAGTSLPASSMTPVAVTTVSAVRTPVSLVYVPATAAVPPHPAAASSTVPAPMPPKDPHSLPQPPPPPPPSQLTAAQLSALGLPLPAAAATSNASLLMAAPPAVQQQQQQLLLAMMQSAPYQQQQQQLLMQQLLSQNAAAAMRAAAAGGGRVPPQHAWPMMMMPAAPRRATPQPSGLPVMMSGSAPQPLAPHTSGLPMMVSAQPVVPQHSGLPGMVSAQPVAPYSSGPPVMVSAQPVAPQPSGLPGMISAQPVAPQHSGPPPPAARLSVPVPVGPRQPNTSTTATPASTTLPIPPSSETGARSGAQTPAMTSSSITVTASVPPPSLQTNIVDQR